MSIDDDLRFDGLYLNVAQTTRGIEPLLDTVFSFLRRKTDFFAGPPGSGDNGTQAAIDKVNQVVKRHADLYLASQKKKKKPAAPKEENNVVEMSKDGGFDVSSPSSSSASKTSGDKKKTEQSPAKPTPPVESPSSKEDDDDDKQKDDPPEKANADDKSEKNGEDKKKDDDERGPPPLGNGGTVPGKYVWTQTLSELAVTVPVPDNTRGRDMNVTIARQHLKVGLRSAPKGEWIIDAPLTKAIIVDDSFWTIEDGNRLILNLQKLHQMEWWDSVCQGHDKINVRDIQPEHSNLSDLDGDTRKTVEKMMYDQRQKAMGKPTSEEEEKLALLEKFKAQHPEMDFSNAKIT